MTTSSSTITAEPPPWHALDPAKVLDELHSNPSGLTQEEARRRLHEHGPNQLEDDPPTHPLTVLLRQFKSPLIYILLGATTITILLEEYLDAAVIGAVLALNAAIGFAQERKAEGAVRALMGLVVPHARVVRDGHEWEIDSRELVPGDVVLLEPGSRVPADLRLLSANTLQIDESLLTGESMPVNKHSAPVDPGHPWPIARRWPTPARPSRAGAPGESSWRPAPAPSSVPSPASSARSGPRPPRCSSA
jgi:Ca2+-transporting ATPase